MSETMEVVDIRKAYDLAHQILSAIMDDKKEKLSPLTITLALSHMMYHLMISAPSIKAIDGVMDLFTTDLDIEGTKKQWLEENEEPSAPEGESLEGTVH